MELTKSDIEYLVNTIDAHIRAVGLKGAQMGLVVGAKLQQMALVAPEKIGPQGIQKAGPDGQEVAG